MTDYILFHCSACEAWGYIAPDLENDMGTCAACSAPLRRATDDERAKQQIPKISSADREYLEEWLAAYFESVYERIAGRPQVARNRIMPQSGENKPQK